MRFETILIVTYGRTGSTLLMSILNTLPGFLIRGENYNFCYYLYKAYEALVNTKNHNGEFTTEPFYGSKDINLDLFKEDALKLIKNQLIPKELQDKIVCWGFKEIRYLQFSKEELFKYLTFLNELFPKPAFICLTRNPKETAKSAWWKDLPEEKVIERITNFVSFLKEWTKDKDNCYWIDYENVKNLDSTFWKLFDFLDVQYDKEKIIKLVNVPHSYNISTLKIKKFTLMPVITPPSMEIFNIDRVPKEIILGQTYSIGGIALPKKNKIKEIILISGDMEFKAKLNIESPFYAKKYPDNPFSKNCRFLFEKVMFMDTASKMKLIFEDGSIEELELSLKEIKNA